MDNCRKLFRRATKKGRDNCRKLFRIAEKTGTTAGDESR
jgi:hypothetical protein